MKLKFEEGEFVIDFETENETANEQSESIQEESLPENEFESTSDQGLTELNNKTRFLQIAFNSDLRTAERVISQLPRSNRILIEAGTPFIKREGIQGIKRLKNLWQGFLVADIKTMDGAVQEVREVFEAGANAATVLGAAPPETISLFVKTCKELRIYSMVDMINVLDPLKALRKLRENPDVVILHKGRDEESTFGKIIEFKHIKRIRSKFNSLISIAGGLYLREAQSAVFNGANIVVVNVVSPQDSWKGIKSTEQVKEIANKFLESIE